MPNEADDNIVLDIAPKLEGSNPAIDKYLDSVVGEEGSEAAPNADAPKGDEGKPEAKTGEEQSPTGQTSPSGAKDGDGKPVAKPEGKKDEKQADPAKGDLVVDGVTYKAGPERRLYEKSKVQQQQLTTAQQETQAAVQRATNAEQQLATLQQTVQSVQGAEPQVVATGVRLVRDIARDPVGTLKTLLTEAVAAGYSIEGIAQGIDVTSIRQAIVNQYKPQLEQLQLQESEQQAQQEAVQEVQRFYTTYPDATIHDAVIAQILDKNPQLSMAEAYFQLKTAVIDRGLDWNKPLPPQMQGSEQQQQQPAVPAAKPMPNGRDVPNAQATVADKTTVAHESSDMGSIVKAAMRESGLNI